MKKIFTTALLAMLGACAFAQTSQGTVVVTGSMYASRYANKYSEEIKQPASTNSKGFSFMINPSYGSFIRDNLEFGIATSVGLSRSRNNSTSDTLTTIRHYHNTIFGLSPYVKKYWALSDRLYLTSGASVSFYVIPSKSETDLTAEVSKNLYQTFMVSIDSGLMFLATEKIGLSTNLASIGYSRGKSRPRTGTKGNSETSESFSLSAFPQNFYFGISYFLNR